MPSSITKLTVFVASPGDVQEERSQLENVITDLNLGVARERGVHLELVRWETHSRPGVGHDAQDVINRQIPVPDIFVGILWKRFGTPTGRADSGTEEEFERAFLHRKAHGTPEILFYFSRRPFFPRSADDLAQIEGVLKFRKRLEEEGVYYWEYEGSDGFVSDARRHLTMLLRDEPPAHASGPPPGDIGNVLRHIDDFKDVFSTLEKLTHEEALTALVYLDLDDFSKFNLRHGMEEGDRFIGAFTRRLAEVIRHKGGSYRVSGDEFVLIFPNHTTAEAHATAERVRLDLPTLVPGGVTASFGIAATSRLGPLETEPGRLFQMAREAMSTAKVAGKNCIKTESSLYSDQRLQNDLRAYS
jgi:diguanylate cyclase (GGDEF)-like protein